MHMFYITWYTYLCEPNVLLMASQDDESISDKFKVNKKYH